MLIHLEKAKELIRNYGISGSKLYEAIPYIRKFDGMQMVVKYGGSALCDKHQELIFKDIIFMSQIGIKVILVHGGSRQLTKRLKEEGIVTEHINGHRATTPQILDLAIKVFDELNDQLVQQLNCLGGKAIGLKGQKTCLLTVKKSSNGGLGLVGVIEKVDVKQLNSIGEGAIPVITPIGIDATGQAYNINADTAASKIAGAISAEKFILLTDVDGVLENPKDPKSLISTLDIEQTKNLMKKGIISSGMVPKVEACLNALEEGVNKTHIINGAFEHSILIEILTEKGSGTEITK